MKTIKKLIIAAMFALASVPAFAADYDVYVDTAEVGPQFVMQIDAGSTNTVTFNILNDGSTITATNYACTLNLSPSDAIGSGKTVTIAGTESASLVQFDMSTLHAHQGMNGYKVVLLVGSTYKAEGKLVIDATPKAVQGNPMVAVKVGAVSPAYQSDTNETTTATGYTPAFIGQTLIGGAGTGTNGLWIAKGVTTNDWVVVAP